MALDLLIVWALVVFSLPALALVALIWLHARLRRVERRLRDLEAPVARAAPAPERPSAPAGVPPAAQRPPAAAPPPAAQRPPAAAPPPAAQPPPAAAPTRPAALAPKSAAGAGLEERLGARLSVWIASIALALAGAFLVKWSFEQGLIGPATRVVLAAALGLVLLAAGYAAGGRNARIGAGLTAAGIADLYASVLAATNLYALVPLAAGFVLLAAITAAAVVLSLRHGAIVALVGLVGGFLTPGLIGAARPQPFPLFFYLLLLQVGLMLVIRRRSWWAFAPLTVAGGLLWSVFWLSTWYQPGQVWLIGPFLVGTAATALYGSRGDGAAREGPQGVLAALAAASGVGGGAVLAAAMSWAGTPGPAEWAFFALLGVGCLWAARTERALAPLAWLAPTVGVVSLWLWGSRLASAPASDTTRFAVVTLLLGALFTAGPYLLLWNARHPGRWAALAGLSAAAHVLTAHAWLPEAAAPWWGALCLGAAALFAGLAVPVRRAARGEPRLDSALAALAVSCGGFVALAAPIELERAWIGVAWAVLVVIVALVHARLRVAALVPFAGCLAVLVAVRLLANPAVLSYPIGSHPLFNWLAYGYGIPIVAFAFAARLFERQGARAGALARWLDGGALALGFALLGLLVRHAFDPELVEESLLTMRETAAYAIVWTAYGSALLLASGRVPVDARTLHWGARVAGLAGLASALFGTCLAANPLLRSERVGDTPLFNALVPAYAIPAALATLTAVLWSRARGAAEAAASGIAALLLAFAFVTLEVRQAFQGARLDGGSAGSAELYAYSAAWLVFGTLLLVGGIRARSTLLRHASLFVMLVAVVKVFLFDTRELTDLYRVFSYLGLGVALLLLAFLYQRFVPRRRGG